MGRLGPNQAGSAASPDTPRSQARPHSHAAGGPRSRFLIPTPAHRLTYLKSHVSALPLPSISLTANKLEARPGAFGGDPPHRPPPPRQHAARSPGSMAPTTRPTHWIGGQKGDSLSVMWYNMSYTNPSRAHFHLRRGGFRAKFPRRHPRSLPRPAHGPRRLRLYACRARPRPHAPVPGSVGCRTPLARPDPARLPRSTGRRAVAAETWARIYRYLVTQVSDDALFEKDAAVQRHPHRSPGANDLWTRPDARSLLGSRWDLM